MNQFKPKGEGSAFQALQLASGAWTLKALAEQETFHPVLGAAQEARVLYLEQTGLESRWQQSASLPLVIWDVGLGAAGNAVEVIRAWERGGQRDVELLSFDLHDEALKFALEIKKSEAAAFGELDGFDWPRILREGGVEFLQGDFRLRWKWYLEDFPQLIAGATPLPAPEVVFYDVYSPAKCPGMWGLEHWKKVRQRLQGDCEVVFHSRSTALRVTLLLAGFYVGRGVAIADKEETTVAATRLELLKKPLDGDWLKRVERSTSARPFTGDKHEPGRISPVDLAKLLQQGQF